MNDIQVKELSLISKEKSQKIKETFDPMHEMLSSFEQSYNKIISDSKNEITSDLVDSAKRLRLDISKVRIETGKIKDKQKEYIRLEDKAIMGVHNIIVWAVKEKEDNLKLIENHFKILEEKRLKDLQSSRSLKLSKYVEDANERNLSSLRDDEFEALLSIKRKEFEDAEEAKKIAEQERIEKDRLEKERVEKEKLKIKAEQERIEKENLKIKAEQERIERKNLKIKAEQKRIERENLKIKTEQEKIERERVERERIERENLKIKAEKERIERESLTQKDFKLILKTLKGVAKRTLNDWECNSYHGCQPSSKDTKELQDLKDIIKKLESNESKQHV